MSSIIILHILKNLQTEKLFSIYQKCCTLSISFCFSTQILSPKIIEIKFSTVLIRTVLSASCGGVLKIVVSDFIGPFSSSSVKKSTFSRTSAKFKCFFEEKLVVSYLYTTYLYTVLTLKVQE